MVMLGGAYCSPLIAQHLGDLHSYKRDLPQHEQPQKIRTWNDLRSDRVELQQHDYSCGSAAVATVLREFYGVQTSETEILDRIGKPFAATYADLVHAAETYGFKAFGYRMPLSDLLKLKIPAIVHLHHFGRGHFSVVRGVRPSDGLIALADPSWGNLRLLPHQLMRMWDVEGKGWGRVLIIVPPDRRWPVLPGFVQRPEEPASAYETLRFLVDDSGRWR
ncbi:MAG: hypothetical protein ISN29_08815 [Gammaproteobacteria bacterium AqS3]|nr:hypothetical protein [Gammaproteobacteria bacterium AqS3]